MFGALTSYELANGDHCVVYHVKHLHPNCYTYILASSPAHSLLPTDVLVHTLQHQCEGVPVLFPLGKPFRAHAVIF